MNSIVGQNMNSMDWWRANHEKFPHLAEQAREILAISATSADAERSFSISGHIMSPRRCRISPFLLRLYMILSSFQNKESRKICLNLQTICDIVTGEKREVNWKGYRQSHSPFGRDQTMLFVIVHLNKVWSTLVEGEQKNGKNWNNWIKCLMSVIFLTTKPLRSPLSKVVCLFQPSENNTQ